MKKWFISFFLLCCSVSAQMTTATFTVHDPNGQAFANGTVSYVINPLGAYQFNGASLSPIYNTPQVVTLDSSGTGTFTAPRSDKITPGFPTWQIVACPNSTSTCTTVQVILNQASQDISATINASIPPIVVNLPPLTRAYTDAQVLASGTTLPVGGVYYNIGNATPGHRYWNGSTFQALGGGTAGVLAINGTPGAFSFNFNPGAGSCSGTTCTFAGGGGSSPTGPQYKAGIYNVGTGPFTLGSANWGTDSTGNNFIMPAAGGTIFAGVQNRVLLGTSPSNSSYSVFTYNNDLTEGGKLGYLACSATGCPDKTLYVDVPNLGAFKWRQGDTTHTSETTMAQLDQTGYQTFGIGVYTNPFDPPYDVASNPLQNYYGGSTKYIEDRNASVIYAGGTHGTALPQTREFQSYDNFIGLGHIWRGSMVSRGASTQVRDYFEFSSGTPGQNIVSGGFANCMSDGDCILGEHFLSSAGNGGQISAENTHLPWDFVFNVGNFGPGTCLGGCGNTNQASIIWGGSVGQYSLLYDFTDVQSGTIVSPIVPSAGQPFYGANLTGISLPVSKIFQINEAIQVDQNVTAASAATQPWQPTPVTVSINTTPYYTGALTTTASLPTNGTGCLTNPPTSSGLSNEVDSREEYEPVFYQVIDSTHLRLWTTFIHSTNTLFAVGGCAIGMEQQAQTDAQGVRTVYPVIATISPTQVLLAGGNLSGAIFGKPGVRNFENGSASIVQVSRSGNVATIVVSGIAGVVGSLNGKTVNITGMTADVSLNGSFRLTTNNIVNQYTYTTATSGTIAPVTQSGTLKTGDTVGNFYPITIVGVPWNPAQPSSPNWYLTTPFTFPTSNAQVGRGEPYYGQYQGGAEIIQPTVDPFFGSVGHTITLSAGAARGETSGGLGSPIIGLDIENPTNPVGVYQDSGGTYLPPDFAIKVGGRWQNGVYLNNGGGTGIFLDAQGLPPNAQSWSSCVFGAVDGAGLCLSDVISFGQSTLQAKIGSYQFVNTVGSNLAFEIDPEFNSSEGLVKSHAKTIIAPDHPHGSFYSLEVDSPTGQPALGAIINGALNLNGSSSPILFNGSPGTAGQCPISGGPGVTPTWGTCGGGGGSGTVGSGTTGQFAFYPSSGTTVQGSSNLSDNGSQIVSTEPINIAGANNGMDLPGAPLPSPVVGHGGVFVDPSGNVYTSDAGAPYARACNATNGICSSGIANTTFVTSTTAIPATSCGTAITVPMSGLLTTSSVSNPTPTVDVSTIVGWEPGDTLYLQPWISGAGVLSVKVCNSGSVSVTPGSAVTWNIGAR